MENEKVELFEDEEIITLYDEDDKPVDFAEIACVEYEGKFYALLQPIDDVEDMEEDEVIICLLEPQDDETEIITPVTDDDLCEKIFNEYLKAVADEECSCGCNCEECEECEDCEDCKECEDCDDKECTCSCNNHDKAKQE